MKIIFTLSAIFLFLYVGHVTANFQISKSGDESSQLLSLKSQNKKSVSDLTNAPSPILDGHLKFIPVDVSEVNVTWEVDYDKAVVHAKAEIRFLTATSGRPILILNPGAQAKWLPSGSKASLKKLSDALSGKKDILGNLMYIDEVVSPNTDYKLRLDYSFTLNQADDMITLPLPYSRNKYAEMGIPSNLMFDRMKTNLRIDIKSDDEFEIIANADVIKHSKNIFSLDFPETFTSFSYFVDLQKAGNTPDKKAKKRKLTSIDSREIDFMVYTDDSRVTDDMVEAFYRMVAGIEFENAEKLLGPYPFDSLIIKLSKKSIGTGSFAGAIVLEPSFYAQHLFHEICHQWVLQHLTPRQGTDVLFFEGFGLLSEYSVIKKGLGDVPSLKDSIDYQSGEYDMWFNKASVKGSLAQAPHELGEHILLSISQKIKTGTNDKKDLFYVLREIIRNQPQATLSIIDFQRYTLEYTGVDVSDIIEYYFYNLP